MKQAAYILAGEPSGDRLAAALMRSVRQDYEFHGIGGAFMKAEGLQSHHNFEALQVIGLIDALRNYSQLKRLMRQMVDEVCVLRPKVIFTVDAKAFSLRFARALKARMSQQGWHAPIIHMVAPTIWAYGAGRKRAFENVFDGMLCLFPMEIGLFDATKLKTAFIGHPAAYEAVVEGDKQRSDVVRLLLLPGSRVKEITTLLPEFFGAMDKLSKHYELQVTCVTLDERFALVEELTKSYGQTLTLCAGPERLKDAFATHDIMLAASGTVTLEAALAGIKGVAAYQLAPLIAKIFTWRFKTTDPILPNIILGEEVYPFYFQANATADPLASGLQRLIEDKDAARRIKRQSHKLRGCLRGEGACFEDSIAAGLKSILRP